MHQYLRNMSSIQHHWNLKIHRISLRLKKWCTKWLFKDTNNTFVLICKTFKRNSMFLQIFKVKSTCLYSKILSDWWDVYFSLAQIKIRWRHITYAITNSQTSGGGGWWCIKNVNTSLIPNNFKIILHRSVRSQKHGSYTRPAWLNILKSKWRNQTLQGF